MTIWVDLVGSQLNDSVIKGFRAIGYPVKKKNTFTLHTETGDTYCSWTLWDKGRRRKVADQAWQDTATPTLCFERGWLRKHDGFQIAWRVGNTTGFNGCGRFPIGNKERWDSWGIEIKPWRTTGDHILICGNKGDSYKGKLTYLINHDHNWPDHIIGEIRKRTDRPIWYRPHPKGGQECIPTRNLPDRLIDPMAESLDESLSGAWCCVVHASSSASEAIVAGIPVIYTAQGIMLADCAGDSLDMIGKPPMPEREKHLYNCTGAQWSLDEIATGYPFQRLMHMRPTP